MYVSSVTNLVCAIVGVRFPPPRPEPFRAREIDDSQSVQQGGSTRLRPQVYASLLDESLRFRRCACTRTSLRSRRDSVAVQRINFLRSATHGSSQSPLVKLRCCGLQPWPALRNVENCANCRWVRSGCSQRSSSPGSVCFSSLGLVDGRQSFICIIVSTDDAYLSSSFTHMRSSSISSELQHSFRLQ